METRYFLPMAVKSYISVDDLSDAEFLQLFRQTAEIKQTLAKDPALLQKHMGGLIGSMMFYEPSTRTSGSFEKAIKLLGGQVYDFNISASSVAKGESVKDTARMVASATQFIVVRHPQKGICKELASILDIPVINAGEGTGEHPTQALLDMFTIYEKFGHTNVTIGLMGDLKHGRTTHSLIKLGARLGANFVCIAPDELQMPPEYVSYAKEQGAKVIMADAPEKAIDTLDVLYVTRLQRERLPEDLQKKFDGQKSGYSVTPELLKGFRSNGIIMHPLPRLDELDEACDTDPRAWYFKQAENGIYTRMALIQHLLGSLDEHHFQFTHQSGIERYASAV